MIPNGKIVGSFTYDVEPHSANEDIWSVLMAEAPVPVEEGHGLMTRQHGDYIWETIIAFFSHSTAVSFKYPQGLLRCREAKDFQESDTTDAYRESK